MFKTLISGRTEFRAEAALSAEVFEAVFKLNLSVLASRQQHRVTSARTNSAPARYAWSIRCLGKKVLELAQGLMQLEDSRAVALASLRIASAAV